MLNQVKYQLLVVLVLVLSFASCEKLLFEDDRGSAKPIDNFEYLWNEIDAKYSYFELKNLDWDSIKQVFAPRINNEMNDIQLFTVLAEMMNTLRDDHSNLRSPFNVSRFNLQLQKPDNFNFRTVEEFYVPNAVITGPFLHDFIDNGRVGYVRYGSFSNGFSAFSLDFILTRYRNTNGLIFDVRENGGGSIFNVPALLERFNDTPRTVGFFITRNGPARNQFSSPQPFTIGKHNGIQYLKPVIILTDRGSYSATTMFALAAKSIPSLTLLGDTTGGGGGVPNGGQLPNGWTYRFSISQLIDLAGDNFAESGVPPQVTVSFNWNDLTKDEIIEAALQLIP
ncbi:MAG: S41 family peptidase [Luteibaculaceae bacterium]